MHIDEPSQSAEQYTIADLIYHAQTQPQSVISDSSVKSYASTLRSFVRKTQLGETALASDLLGDEFEGHLAQVDGKSDKSRLRKWRQLYRQLITSEKQHAFGDVLREAIKSKGITGYELAKRLSVSRSAVSAWNQKKCLPGDIGLVEKMEVELSIKPGLLVQLIPKIIQEPHKRIPESWWPSSWRRGNLHVETEKKMVTVYFIGQSNLSLPEEDLKPLFDASVRRVQNGEHLPEWRRKLTELLALPYEVKISEWPGEMKNLWEDIEEYMTSPSGFSNQNRNSRWRPETARMKLSYLAKYAGFLTLPVHSEDNRLRGLGI